MYQALYREWRPRQFSGVVGRPQVTFTLENELLFGRLAHAYLFTGSRGTGKAICAKILAKAVNCLSPQNGGPRGECEIYHGLDNGSVMDMMETGVANNSDVENIRILRGEANFTSVIAKYHVYITSEVYMLSIDVLNALLKTLEEPPEYAILILATTEVHKLPVTVLSRYQRFDSYRIAPVDTADRLTYTAGEENASAEPQATLLPARLVDGASRDVPSLLDQCLGRSRGVVVDIVTQTVGLVGRGHLSRLADAITRGDVVTALLATDELYIASRDMARLCKELSGYFRGLVPLKTMKDARDILVAPEEEYQAMSVWALPTFLPVILHCLDAIQDASKRIYRGDNRWIEMETAVLYLCSPEPNSGTDTLVRRIATLERKGVAPVVQTVPSEPQVHRVPEPAPVAVAAPAPSVPPAPTVQCREPDDVPSWMEEPLPDPYEPVVSTLSSVPKEPVFKEAPKQSAVSQAVRESDTSNAFEELQGLARPLGIRPEILQTMKDYPRVVAALFARLTAYTNGEYVLIDAPSPTALELLRRLAQRDKMCDAVKQVTGHIYKLGSYKKPQMEQTKEQDPLRVLAESAAATGIPMTQ